MSIPKGVFSYKVFYEKYPLYADEDYLLGLHETALTSRDSELLSYVRLLPVKELSKFKEVFIRLLLEKWHNENDDLIGYFQQVFHNDQKDIETLVTLIDIIPESLKDDDFKYPYIRKIIYAIGAQPEPYNIEALEKIASDTTDPLVRDLASHQINKRLEKGRWEAARNANHNMNN